MLTEVAGWRWIFAVNIPIGVAALLVSRRALRGSRRDTQRGGPVGIALDLSGAVLVSTGIAAGTLGLSWLAEDPEGGTAWAALAVAAAALLLFVRHEGRSRSPLVPGAVIRRPGVVGGNLTAAALTASTTPAMLTAIFYVQNTLRLSPAQGSLLFPPFNLAVIAGSFLGPYALARIGYRTALMAGFSGVVGGIAVLLALPEHGVPLALLLGAFSLMGLGLGVASVASTAAGSAAVAPEERGVAAGLLNSTAQLGTALGLAVTAPIVAAAAPMTGYRLGFAAAAVIGVAGGLSALTVPSRPPGPGGDAGATPRTREPHQLPSPEITC